MPSSGLRIVQDLALVLPVFLLSWQDRVVFFHLMTTLGIHIGGQMILKPTGHLLLHECKMALVSKASQSKSKIQDESLLVFSNASQASHLQMQVVILVYQVLLLPVCM